MCFPDAHPESACANVNDIRWVEAGHTTQSILFAIINLN
jgi:hypothetical protein